MNARRRPPSLEPSSPSSRGPHPGAEWLVVIVFLVAIWLPCVQMACHLFPSVDTLEKRKPMVAPRPSLRAPHRFLWEYGKYFREDFGLRGILIRWDTVMRLKLLHASPVSKLVFGRSGWIFYDSEKVPDGVTMVDFKGLVPFTSRELVAVRGSLERQTRWCRERGIACVFIVVPNKETIYPEYLPKSVRRFAPRTRLDQVVGAIGADSTIMLIDLRSPLLQAKNRCPYPLYSRGGTHWNQFGAFYAYQAVLARLSRFFPRLHPHDLEDFDIVVDRNSSEDHWLGLRENVSSRFSLKPGRRRTRADGEIGKAVVIYDSSWDALEPFLSLHIRRMVQEHVDLSRDRSRPLLERERPDLVVYEMTERYLGWVLRERGF
jgi:alginate O-acetyltransferase complex protein AlgJ